MIFYQGKETTDMPEGPSIVILKELVQSFLHQTVMEVSGSTKINKGLALNKPILDFKSWGKHFLICFEDFTIRIHFLLFGSYRINESKTTLPRLGLKFADGELNFYACAVTLIQEPLEKVYDFTEDVMQPEWDARKAKQKLLESPGTLVCDALLDQTIFSGVGNIIKNEVLFRIFVHPESAVGKLQSDQLDELIEQARQYSFEFLEWKKAFMLNKHWLAHTKKTCLRCQIPFVKKKTGKTNRRSFFCENCQVLYI